MKYYLAVDIGGTKTKMCVFDEKHSLVKTYDTLGAGLSFDSSEDIPHLSEKAKEMAKQYKIVSVSVNLGGKNTEQITNIFKTVLKTENVNVFRESDAVAAFSFGEKYKADIVLLAGTGTIALAKDNAGQYVVSGGWGANIGDDGSGYSIGLAAVRQAYAALDNTNELTEMQKEITGENEPFKKADSVSAFRDARDKVRAKFAPLDRRAIASVCHVVEKHCDNNESDALEIMKNAGLDMAKLIVNTYNKLLPYKPTAVAVAGGLVKISRYWKDAFEEYIKQNSDIKEIYYDSDGVIIGTIEIAKKDFEKTEGVL